MSFSRRLNEPPIGIRCRRRQTRVVDGAVRTRSIEVRHASTSFSSAGAEESYPCALDMSQWADGIGLKAVGLSEHHSAQYDIKNENHVIVTIRQRHTLCHYEKRELEMIETTCHVLEPRVIDQSLVNPKVKAKALKLPPRKCSDEIACQWE